MHQLLNAFPKNVNHNELSYTSSDIKLLTITYAFSHMNVNHLDVSGIIPSRPQIDDIDRELQAISEQELAEFERQQGLR